MPGDEHVNDLAVLVDRPVGVPPDAVDLHIRLVDEPAVGARLTEVRIGANFLQDPNGDPNLVQRFKVRSIL